MWEKVLKWILNPITIVGIILVLLLFSVNNLSHKNQNLNDKVAQKEQTITAQNKSIYILGEDNKSLAELNNKKLKIYGKQQELSDKLNEIKDTSTNKPFTNPELLDAAIVMRDYQNSVLNSNSADSNN